MTSTSSDQNSTEVSVKNEAMTAGFSSSGHIASPSQRKVAAMLLATTNVIREACEDPEVPSQIIAMLLLVASLKEPSGVAELGRQVGMSSSSASRLVQRLGRGTLGKPGLGLVETREDPLKWVRKLVTLTPKGVEVVAKLEDKLMVGMRSLARA